MRHQYLAVCLSVLGLVVGTPIKAEESPQALPAFASDLGDVESVATQLASPDVPSESGSQLNFGPAEALPQFLVQAAAEETSPPPRLPSLGYNLPVLRAFKKPRAAYPLDSGVNIAGIQPRDLSGSLWTRDYLLGDWGGARSRLYEGGIDVTLAHFVEVFGVVSGGLEQSSAYSGATTISFDLYTDRMGWWDGGTIHFTNGWFEGPSVARNFVGAFNSVYFADPPLNGFTVFELWYGQKWTPTGGGTAEFRFGKIYPFVRIGASQTAGFFSNASFNYPHFLGTIPGFGGSFVGAATAYPQAPFGVQVLYSPNRTWDFALSLMDGFNDPSGGVFNRYGTAIDLDDREGMEGIVEVVYKPNQEAGATDLPGFYRLGFQFHTGLFDVPATDPLESRQGNHAFFFIAEQMIFRESPDPSDRTQGMNAFFKLYHVPKSDINTITWNFAGGLAYAGLIPGRDRDVVGLGVTHTVFSDGARRFDQAVLGVEPRTAETVIEVFYSAELAPWWQLTGSLQHIVRPSGDPTIPNATVLGVSSRFGF